MRFLARDAHFLRKLFLWRLTGEAYEEAASTSLPKPATQIRDGDANALTGDRAALKTCLAESA